MEQHQDSLNKQVTELKMAGHGAAEREMATLEVGQRIGDFSVASAEPVAEISGTAYVFSHPSGARTLWLANDDNNKSFAIAFKTPPANDTGVFHILEHSVLCGSEHFPVKEPFVNLLKTSMQTFLNALTFSDKTMYPVASTNEQDLLNLMDVYLDAVLHPAIYQRKRIFEQEGWHYEVDEKNKSLSYNGVVFNEMKGALSDPDEVLFEELNRQLFPDSAYRFESGGDPRAIPQLTYEEFLDTHARHYQLSNSYTVLYGNLNIQHVLDRIGEHFAAATDRGAGEPNTLTFQQPIVAAPTTVHMATAAENARVGLGFVLGTSEDRTRVLAVDILLDALMGSNEAPLKRAIMQANLGDDVSSFLIDGQLQPLALLQLKGAKPGVADQFEQLVHDVCDKLARDGIDPERLEASFAQAEFNLREGDWGYYADGVALAIQSLNSWLYNDDDALSYVRYEDALAAIKAHLEAHDGWFETLLREVLIGNTHRARVELVPEEAGASQEEAAELAAYAASLSTEKIEALATEAAALHAEQAQPDSPEALATLPQLTLADITDAPAEPEAAPIEGRPARGLHHKVTTRNIDYVNLYFGLERVAWEDLPYLSVLSTVLGELGTREHTAAELDTLLETHLGDFGVYVDIWSDFEDANRTYPKLVISTSAVAEKVRWAARLPKEVWSSTVFDDPDRIRDLLVQRRTRLEQSFVGSGHAWAANRAMSYVRPTARYMQQIRGVDNYLFVRDLLEHFDERAEALIGKLKQLSSQIFAEGNLFVSFGGTDEELAAWWDEAGSLALTPAPHAAADATAGADATTDGSHAAAEKRLVIPENTHHAEAFIVPTDVSYMCDLTDDAAGQIDQGTWGVVSRVLSLDYLWNEVRVLGGAYGAGFTHSADKLCRMYSYRDPQVDATLERMGRAAAWLAKWEPTEDELVGYVVSAVSGLDAPTKPRAWMQRHDAQLFRNTPEGYTQQMRASMLQTSVESIRACAAALAELEKNHERCVFGSKELLEGSDLAWDYVDLMGKRADAE